MAMKVYEPGMDTGGTPCPECGNGCAPGAETCDQCGCAMDTEEPEDDADDPEVEPISSEDHREIVQLMSEGYAWWSQQMEWVRRDLAFASGNQWDEDATLQRTGELNGGVARPLLVSHALRPYLNRVINPVRMYPFAIEISPKRLPKGEDPQKLVDKASKIVRGYMRRIEARSRAAEAYELAYTHAVTAGVGYITVGLDYPTPEAMDRQAYIGSVDDPTTTVLDPNSTLIDGSDAMWGAVIRPVGKATADLMCDDRGGDIPEGCPGIMSGWQQTVPADTVWELLFYRKSEEEATRYRLADGKDVWEIPEGATAVKKRKTVRRSVECFHWIGDCYLGMTVMNTQYIPIVPVYGDRVYLLDRKWAGMVHWARDNVQLTNYYLSSEAEVIGQAPRAVWLISEGQVEGHEDEFDTSNQTPRTRLTYRTESYTNGQGVPVPSRVSTGADTGGLIASRQNVLQEMARALGISDNALGRMENGAESGTAVNYRTANGEVSTAQYSQNLAMSVAQVGRVVVDLVRGEEKGPRYVEIQEEDGTVVEEKADIGQLFEALGDIDVDSSAGPSYASSRRESVATLMAMAQVMPDRMPIMADVIANNSDAPGSDVIAARFKKLLPPELQDQEEGAIDPQAKAALDAADQTIQQQSQAIDELKGYVQQFQAQIIDNKKDRETDILKAVIDSRTKLAVEHMKQAGMDGRLAAEIVNENDKELDKAMREAGVSQLGIDTALPGYSGRLIPPAPGPVSYDSPDTTAALDQIEAATRTLGDAPVGNAP